MAETVQYYGTGRRKAAIARVYLRPGSGEFKVNGKAFEEYFVTSSQRVSAKSPLVSTDTAANFNVLARVCGGGVAGQADAVRLGVTRAPKSARSMDKKARENGSSSASGSGVCRFQSFKVSKFQGRRRAGLDL